jgi:crossover junction endodeoxyribonuclease RuvC
MIILGIDPGTATTGYGVIEKTKNEIKCVDYGCILTSKEFSDAERLTDIPIYEFTPLQIKMATVGYGRAEKKQVQKMVKLLLNLEKTPKPDDAADALAAAICCSYCIRAQGLYQSQFSEANSSKIQGTRSDAMLQHRKRRATKKIA